MAIMMASVRASVLSRQACILAKRGNRSHSFWHELSLGQPLRAWLNLPTSKSYKNYSNSIGRDAKHLRSMGKLERSTTSQTWGAKTLTTLSELQYSMKLHDKPHDPLNAKATHEYVQEALRGKGPGWRTPLLWLETHTFCQNLGPKGNLWPSNSPIRRAIMPTFGRHVSFSRRTFVPNVIAIAQSWPIPSIRTRNCRAHNSPRGGGSPLGVVVAVVQG